MRVVLLGNNSRRRPGDVSFLSLAELAAALQRRGHEITIVHPDAPAPEGRALVAALRRPGGWLSLGRYRRAMRRALAPALQHGVDLVHAHAWFPAGLVAPAEVPLVLSMYGSDVETLTSSRRARTLAAPVLARARVVGVDSGDVGNAVQHLMGRHVGRAYVQPMPVDSSRWPWTLGGDGAIAIADLVPASRMELAIETAAALAAAGQALPLTIIGTGPRRRDLGRLAKARGVEALVHFVDEATPDEIQTRLASADLMLHPPSAAPAAPWALAAVLTGVPLVACWDGGCVVELIADASGSRLTLPSAEAFAESARSALSDPARFALARLVGEARRARLTPDDVASVMESWYREALVR